MAGPQGGGTLALHLRQGLNTGCVCVWGGGGAALSPCPCLKTPRRLGWGWGGGGGGGGVGWGWGGGLTACATCRPLDDTYRDRPTDIKLCRAV